MSQNEIPEKFYVTISITSNTNLPKYTYHFESFSSQNEAHGFVSQLVAFGNQISGASCFSDGSPVPSDEEAPLRGECT